MVSYLILLKEFKTKKIRLIHKVIFSIFFIIYLLSLLDNFIGKNKKVYSQTSEFKLTRSIESSFSDSIFSNDNERIFFQRFVSLLNIDLKNNKEIIDREIKGNFVYQDKNHIFSFTTSVNENEDWNLIAKVIKNHVSKNIPNLNAMLAKSFALMISNKTTTDLKLLEQLYADRFFTSTEEGHKMIDDNILRIMLNRTSIQALELFYDEKYFNKYEVKYRKIALDSNEGLAVYTLLFSLIGLLFLFLLYQQKLLFVKNK